MWVHPGRFAALTLSVSLAVISCGPVPVGVAPSASSSLAVTGSPSLTPSAPATIAVTASPSLTPTPAPTPLATPVPTPAPTDAPSVAAIHLTRAMGSVTFNSMTSAVQAADGRWYVLEQAGRVMTFRDGDAAATVFLDIRDHVQSGGEMGLLGIALAPDFAASGVFFLDYTQGGPLRTHIASFTSDRLVANKTSEVVILEIAQPFENHNGGQLAFGPDGYLYIGMGDGGSGGDPYGNGQNQNVLLGKILRIDVHDRTKYAIPPDNPLFGRREIWAYGFRNPWRFSFDTNGRLWVADVGQNAYEEVDVVAKGGNYGWNRMEGFHCYGASQCDRAGLDPPVAEYDHSEGCSVTGGYVDRGAAPALQGIYFFADYCSGRVWGLRYDAGRVTALAQVATTGFAVSSFAQDRSGEVYVLQYASAGRFYKIIP